MKTLDRLFIPGFREMRAGEQITPELYAKVLAERPDLDYSESTTFTGQHEIIKSVTASNESVRFAFAVRFANQIDPKPYEETDKPGFVGQYKNN